MVSRVKKVEENSEIFRVTYRCLDYDLCKSESEILNQTQLILTKRKIIENVYDRMPHTESM